jgi:hypothetical protein
VSCMNVGPRLLFGGIAQPCGGSLLLDLCMAAVSDLLVRHPWHNKHPVSIAPTRHLGHGPSSDAG